MKLTVLRLDNQSSSTKPVSCRSLAYIDGVLECGIMEDPVREKKIAKITAIPAGVYEVKIRQDITPKTIDYRERYPDWFDKHLHIQDVPGYSGIYIHIGNKPKNSDGCLLVNNIFYTNDPTKMGDSTNTFRKFYQKIVSAIESGDKVMIDIRNVFESIGQNIIPE